MLEGELKKYYRVEWVKLSTQFFLLAFLIALQFSQKDFIHWSLQSSVLFLLSISLPIHSLYILFLDKLKIAGVVHYLLFCFDVIWITSLMYFFPSIQALFVFMYLIYILLSGLLFGKIGALVIASFTSFVFSVLLVFSPQIDGQLLYLSLGLNNLGFFLIAILSGTLSEQLKAMGVELQQKSKDLQVLKDLNKLIIENMKSGFITIDLQNKVLLYNKSALDILEKKIVEEMQADFLFPEAMKKIAAENIDGVLQLHHSYRVNNRTKKLLLLYSEIKNEENKAIGGMLIFSDQTEFHRLEEELKQNEKLAAIGKLAAGIAHEIRNPLASMSGSIQFLSEGLKTASDEDKKLMSIILKEIDRLNHLVTEFLDFAKPEKTLSGSIILSDVCNETLEILKRDARFSREIDLNIDIENNIEILGDKHKLIQVLMNLLINACQAVEESAVKKVDLSLKKQGKFAILKISDSGVGMSKEVKERLFEPFHTTKPKGTGLGLAVVHKILDFHHAKVQVESKQGEGCTFTITFPLL